MLSKTYAQPAMRMLFTTLPPLLYLVIFLYLSSAFTQRVAARNMIRCIERERQALLDFKQSLVDEDGVLSSWGSDVDQRECCNWWGVHCNNNTGHVTMLDLNNVRYDGLRGHKVSSSLLELKHLSYLDLSYNDFQWSRIPEFIGSFRRLRVLSLMEANFSGTIPPQIGNLTNLHILNIAGSNLKIKNFEWLSLLSSLRSICLDNVDIDLTGSPETRVSLPPFLEELQLSGCQITGHFPNLSHASSLRVLDLYGNQITGHFPDLSHASSLRVLDLSENQLQGGLPESIRKLSKLEELHASSNSLEGVVTEAHFSNLTNLQFLDLSFNLALSFNLSSNWVPPFQLQTISLANCKMGPQFPKWLQTQSKILELDISSGGISDIIPYWFWNFSKNCYYLNLSYNEIGGRLPYLPIEFSALEIIDLTSNNFWGPISINPRKISILHLSNNKFVGSISFLCSIISFHTFSIDLSNNQLSHEIPDCWHNSLSLFILNLANNRFFGKVPHSLGSLFKIGSLYLRNNNLTGELPSSLQNCTSLKVIDFGGNKFIGRIPSWIGGSLMNLQIVSLRHNKLYGNVPSSICHLNSIQILDLSGNKLTGEIPRCFNNFTYLMQISSSIGSTIRNLLMNTSFREIDPYMDNILIQWKNQEWEYRKQLGLLKAIDLSSNQLIGDIPEELSALKGLISLNLSNNHLTGKIFLTIYQMEYLEVLDLSRNQLSGEIPMGLARLNYLDVLDLSSNFLSGKIPTSTQLQSFNASSYAENIGLCGDPLPKCSADVPPQSINNDYQEDNNFLDRGFYISMVLGFSLSFWGIVVTLVLKDLWRSAYYGFLNDVKDWLYVKMKIYLVRLQRKYRRT